MIASASGVGRNMNVEIWSDVVCPWCYIGKRRFEAALAAFEHRDEVEVRWRSFELDPSAPRHREGDYATRLSGKYGVTVDQAEQIIQRMEQTGAGEGLELRFDRAQPGNTFDAHRLLHLAADRGVQAQLKERLLAATFTEGQPIGEPDVLVALAAEAGLDAGEAGNVLDGDAYASDVRADEYRATRLGITAVPFFVVDGRYGVSGAQAPEVILSALEQGWRDGHEAALVTTKGQGPGCDADACEL